MQPEFRIAIAVLALSLGLPFVCFLLYAFYRGLLQHHEVAPFDITNHNINLAEMGRRSGTAATFRSGNPSVKPSVIASAPSSRSPSAGRAPLQSINRDNYDIRGQPKGILRVDLPADAQTISSIPRRFASFQSTVNPQSDNKPGHARTRSGSAETL